MTDRDRGVPSDEGPVDPQILPKHIVDAAFGRGRTAEDLEVVRIWIEETQHINATYTFKRPWGASTGRLKNLVHGTRTRRAIARLRSYAIRGRVTAEVRLLDDFALARVKLYNSLFGLPHDLFKEIVSKL